MHDGETMTPNDNLIDYIEENMDWQASNDPCAIELGNGWRLPTGTEWMNVDEVGGWTGQNGPWNSSLKMHMAGYIWIGGEPIGGYLLTRGANGYYFSSNQNTSTDALRIEFYFNGCYMNTVYKANALPVRCLKE